MFLVKSRYEYWKQGKEWTKWFTVAQLNTEQEAMVEMERRIKDIKHIDTITKLKHEFCIENLEETEK